MAESPSEKRSEKRVEKPTQDPTTTVAQLRRMVADFVDARDWRQFHTPKNISMALAIEAAELMETLPVDRWPCISGDCPRAGEAGRGGRRIGRRAMLWPCAGQRTGPRHCHNDAREDGQERAKISGRRISWPLWPGRCVIEMSSGQRAMVAQTSQRNRSPLRWSVWLTYGVILAISIPWYWPADDQTLWLGMPAWAATAVLGSLAMSTFTALLIWRCWPALENNNSVESIPAEDLLE